MGVVGHLVSSGVEEWDGCLGSKGTSEDWSRGVPCGWRGLLPDGLGSGNSALNTSHPLPRCLRCQWLLAAPFPFKHESCQAHGW